MKLNFVNRTLMVGALLAVGLGANAAPLQRADLPADLAWVIHVDVDALRPTAIGQVLQSEMDKPQNQARLSIFQSVSGFDLRTQLHGLTLYSASTNPADGVLLVYADFDPAKLVTLAKAGKDPQSTTYKAHTIYSWIDKDKPKHPRVYGAIEGARVILGQQQASVGQALDVLDGAVPKLSASNTFPQLGAIGDTSFLEAAASKLVAPPAGPHAVLFRLSKQALLQINETQGQINAILTLEAKDEAVAEQMLNIGQGLIGLLKLQDNNPEATKLANALAVKQDGTRVVATLSLPSGDVAQLLKTLAARHAAHHDAQKPAAETEAK